MKHILAVHEAITSPMFSQLLKVEVALSEVGVARPEGPCPLGGSGGMLPQEILKF